MACSAYPEPTQGQFDNHHRHQYCYDKRDSNPDEHAPEPGISGRGFPVGWNVRHGGAEGPLKLYRPDVGRRMP